VAPKPATTDTTPGNQDAGATAGAATGCAGCGGELDMVGAVYLLFFLKIRFGRTSPFPNSGRTGSVCEEREEGWAMKRFGAVASLLLVAAIGVGAFVYAGSDSGSSRKGSAPVVQSNNNGDKTNGKSNDSNDKTTTTTAKKDDPKTSTPQVASDTPIPKSSSDDNVFHVGDDEKPELDGYEARRVFVGVSPSVSVTGRKVEIQVRGFAAKETVNVTFSHSVNGIDTLAGGTTIVVDQRGRGKGNAVAPSTGGIYTVKAIGVTSGRSAGAILKVVLKK
jgi:hypothetical protein